MRLIIEFILLLGENYYFPLCERLIKNKSEKEGTFS